MASVSSIRPRLRFHLYEKASSTVGMSLELQLGTLWHRGIGTGTSWDYLLRRAWEWWWAHRV